MGALEIAGNAPIRIAGIALAAAGPDLFEEFAYGNSTRTMSGPDRLLVADECGHFPGTSLAATGLLYSMSSGRLYPGNFSSVRIWVSGGGMDSAIPNSYTFWNYAEVNASFYNSSSRTAGAYGEPVGATTTWESLHASNPSSFAFRYVFEPRGVHSMAQFAVQDVFRFWAGLVGGGVWHGGFPPTTISPGP
jgi:hypothetical protein